MFRQVSHGEPYASKDARTVRRGSNGTPRQVGSRILPYDLPEGGCFAITTLAEGVNPSHDAGGSIAFEVEDLDDLVTKLKANQVTFKLDIFTSPVCRMAVIIDSEGNAVTLHQKNRKA